MLSPMAKAMVEQVWVAAIKDVGAETALLLGGVDWHYENFLRAHGDTDLDSVASILERELVDSNGVKANTRAMIASDLETYGPTPEEIEDTYQNVLFELTKI